MTTQLYKVRDLVNDINKVLSENFAKQPIRFAGYGHYDEVNGRKIISVSEVSIMVENIIQDKKNSGEIPRDMYFSVVWERNTIRIDRMLFFKVKTKRSDIYNRWSRNNQLTAVSIEVKPMEGEDLETIMNRTLKSYAEEKESIKINKQNSIDSRVNEFLSMLEEAGVSYEKFIELKREYAYLTPSTKRKIEELANTGDEK